MQLSYLELGSANMAVAKDEPKQPKQPKRCRSFKAERFCQGSSDPIKEERMLPPQHLLSRRCRTLSEAKFQDQEVAMALERRRADTGHTACLLKRVKRPASLVLLVHYGILSVYSFVSISLGIV